MATTAKSNVIIPEILVEAVKGQFAGMQCLFGSPAAAVKTGLPGDKRGGDKVKVPYFGTIGEFEDVAEGAALTPVNLTQSSEEATVERSGKAFEAGHWARLAAAEDPYTEAARQLVVAMRRKADSKLIAAAVAAGLPADHIKDVWNATTPRKIDYDLVIDGRMAFADEQDGISMVAIHSKVFGDLLKLKDGEGRPLATDVNGAGLGRFAGVPLLVSDRCPVDSTDPSNPKYTSILFKANALAFWFNETPRIETDRDIYTDKDMVAVHMYYAVHRYSRLEGTTKPGIVLLKHN